MSGIDHDCVACGSRHEGRVGSVKSSWPALGFHRPDPYLLLTPHERERHARATDDLCVIDRPGGQDCFVRGLLPLPIVGEPCILEYGPWVAVSASSFTDYVENYERADHREHYAGHLATAIPGYSRSAAVPAQVDTQGMFRPQVVPDSTFGHALVRDFYDGITRKEADLRVRETMLGEEPW
jgi:hypothetical protein